MTHFAIMKMTNFRTPSTPLYLPPYSAFVILQKSNSCNVYSGILIYTRVVLLDARYSILKNKEGNIMVSYFIYLFVVINYLGYLSG